MWYVFKVCVYGDVEFTLVIPSVIFSILPLVFQQNGTNRMVFLSICVIVTSDEMFQVERS